MSNPIAAPTPTWTIDESGPETRIKELEASSEGVSAWGYVATVHHHIPNIKEKRARLIAAAPQLFDALLEIMEYSGGAANALEDPYVMERANVAINNAILGSKA